MLNPHRRLESVTQSMTVKQGDGEHRFEISLAYGDGVLREVTFVGKGKTGHGLDSILTDIGIGLSRMIQGRNPNTGEPL